MLSDTDGFDHFCAKQTFGSYNWPVHLDCRLLSHGAAFLPIIWFLSDDPPPPRPNLWFDCEREVPGSSSNVPQRPSKKAEDCYPFSFFCRLSLSMAAWCVYESSPSLGLALGSVKSLDRPKIAFRRSHHSQTVTQSQFSIFHNFLAPISLEFLIIKVFKDILFWGDVARCRFLLTH